jgi:hypothetical protein
MVGEMTPAHAEAEKRIKNIADKVAMAMSEGINSAVAALL